MTEIMQSQAVDPTAGDCLDESSSPSQFKLSAFTNNNDPLYLNLYFLVFFI
jgi:hypothetical protein